MMRQDDIPSLILVPMEKRQKRIAMIQILMILLVFCAMLPFANMRLPEFKPFLPAFSALIAFTDWVTAYLLFNQFRLTSSLLYLLMSLTYFFSGASVIPFILTFPEVFSDHLILGAGNQTTTYFWVLWHGGFPFGLLICACVERHLGKVRLTSRQSKILPWALAGGILLFLYGFFVLTTKYHHWLPIIIIKDNYTRLITTGIGPAIVLLNVAAFLTLGLKKEKTLLHMLIMMSALASLLDVSLTLLGSERYTLGWYAARLLSLLSASVLLSVFVFELNRLYARLTKSEYELRDVHWQLQKQHEKTLASEERYRTLVENSPMAILVISEGAYQYINEEGLRLLGIDDKAQILGKPAGMFALPEKREWLQKLADQVAKEQTKWQSREKTITMVGLDQRVIQVEATAVPIFYDGKPAVQFFIHDVSEKIMAQEMLNKSDKLAVIGQLAAGIAHEIRNPLTTLKGFIQFLSTSRKPNHEYYAIMLSEVERLNEIVSDFMTLAKPQAVTKEVRKLHEIVQEVVTFLKMQALLVKIDLLTEWKDEALNVLCDERQLKQVLINIIKNAMEAMPQGGEIRVEIDKQGDYARIRVIDQGCGIPEDRLPKLGEPFYSTKEKGTGLGLLTSFRIIEEHQGRLQIQSKLGEGTTVEILQPLWVNDLYSRNYSSGSAYSTRGTR